MNMIYTVVLLDSDDHDNPKIMNFCGSHDGAVATAQLKEKLKNKNIKYSNMIITKGNHRTSTYVSCYANSTDVKSIINNLKDYGEL